MLLKKDKHEKPIAIFRKFGGTARTSEVIRTGIHSRTLYEMLAAGVVEKLSRGLYRLSLSHHSDKFVLKGDFMLTVWEDRFHVPQ